MSPLLPIALAGIGVLLLTQTSKKSGTGPGGTSISTTPGKPPGPGGGPGSVPGGVAGLPGCPPSTTNAGVASLPEPYKTAVQAALLTSTSPDSLDILANELQACGQTVAAGEVRARAAALRAGGGLGLPGSPGGPGGDTKAGPIPPGVHYASAPGVAWRHMVVEGEGPILITSKYFGSGDAKIPSTDKRRFIELIEANPGKKTVGDKGNPFSTENPDGKMFNFASLLAGEDLNLPPSWNDYVSEGGYRRAAPTPFPKRGTTGMVV